MSRQITTRQGDRGSPGRQLALGGPAPVLPAGVLVTLPDLPTTPERRRLKLRD